MSTPVIDAHVTLGRVDHLDVAAEELLTRMDASGVDIAVLSPDPREVAVAHREGHHRLRALSARHPGRLLTYATANPWYGSEGVVELARSLDDGAVAVKFDPARQGFQPVDSIVDPFVEVARERGVPVYVHTGTPVHATPFQVAALARRFPDVAFILGRCGKTDFKTDGFAALAATPNLYGDTAHDFPLTGMSAQLAAAPDRVVFSSDFPFGEVKHELSRTKDLPVDDDVLRAVLGSTFLSLLPQYARAAILGRTR